MEFNLVNLRFQITTDNTAALVQWLFRAGAEFSSACRDAICQWPVRDCQKCPERRDCPWNQVFSQKLALNPDALKRHQKPPLPFVFSFECLDSYSGNSGTVTVKFVVVGGAISCLDMLLTGFAALVERHTENFYCKLGTISSLDYQGNARVIGEDVHIDKIKDLVILSASGVIDCRHQWDCDRIGFNFTTPLRLVHKGHILKHFNPSTFTRSLLRRVSSMAYYYGDCSEADFKELSSQSDRIKCCEDTSSFKPLWMGANKFSGIIGNCLLSGNFDDLLPFFILGSYLHVGKGASFGMGNYALYTDQVLV